MTAIVSEELISLLDDFKSRLMNNSLSQFEQLLLSEMYMKAKMNNYIDSGSVDVKTIFDKLSLGHYIYENARREG